MRVAIVHDWLTGMRGGERVLEQLIAIFPTAELFTLLHVPGSVSDLIEARPIHTSWIQRLPLNARSYRYYLPLFPRAIEGFDLHGFDLIVSSSHCVAKGVRVPAGVPHVCYCHTPMRYLYDQSDAYARRFSWLVVAAFAAHRSKLQRWDRASTGGVTQFIANSAHVRDRIATLYGRAASIVHPPVAVDRFHPRIQRADYYVSLAALVPYKCVDLVVHAFNRLDRRLVVVGTGPELRHLQRIANRNIEFTGWLSDQTIADLLSSCRGLVFAGVEDFGIALVEAQAAGAPVIARAAGGALEIVKDTPHGGTGVLFEQPNSRAVARAVIDAEQRAFVPADLHLNSLRFQPERFRSALRAHVDALVAGNQLAAV